MDNKHKKIYTHLFLSYTATIIIALVLLNAYFLKYSVDTKKQTATYINQQLVGDVNAKVENTFNITDLVADSIYSYRGNILDLLRFISIDFNKYKEEKLDEISGSQGISYFGTEILFERSFNTYDNILNISTISRERNEVRTFNRNTQIDFKTISNYDELRKKEIIFDKNTITHIIKLNDITNLEEKGLLCVTYSFNDIRAIMKEYGSSYSIFVLGDNEIIYNSSDKLNEKVIATVLELSKNKEFIKQKTSEYYNLSYIGDNITIASRVENENKLWLTSNFYIVLAIINIIIFVVAEVFIYLKVKSLNKRMESLVKSMEAVENGNLDVFVDVDNHEADELSYIAGRFNFMCKQLKTYINKSYIAEINQKNAEMERLQSQINPHFLYNTLEVIRMKAVCSGNKDVGKMLQNLAVLFRSQVKEKNIITIEKELGYCRKYLDLFKLRYDDKFSYDIICDNDEILQMGIIKFIIQPILENYIVHGVRLSDDDNKLVILVSAIGSDINIEIKDNGIGISQDKLCEIKKKIGDKNYKSDSIGITNVNQRIQNTYGENYGVKFGSIENVGTTVLIKIPKN